MVLVPLSCTKHHSLFQPQPQGIRQVNVGCQKVIQLHDFKNHYPQNFLIPQFFLERSLRLSGKIIQVTTSWIISQFFGSNFPSR